MASTVEADIEKQSSERSKTMRKKALEHLKKIRVALEKGEISLDTARIFLNRRLAMRKPLGGALYDQLVWQPGDVEIDDSDYKQSIGELASDYLHDHEGMHMFLQYAKYAFMHRSQISDYKEKIEQKKNKVKTIAKEKGIELKEDDLKKYDEKIYTPDQVTGTISLLDRYDFLHILNILVSRNRDSGDSGTGIPDAGNRFISA